ncbi:MAG: kelch repeat-containing protein, partial [Pseudomonadota bacterium]
MTNLTRRSAIAGGTGLLLSTAAGAVEKTERPIGAWREFRSHPFPVQEIYPVAHRLIGARDGSTKPEFRQVIVNAGGLTPNSNFAYNVTDIVTIYDPRTGRWREGPPLPYPTHHAALVSNSGAITAIGGFRRDDIGGWQMENRVWRLDDLDRGYWEEVAPLSIPQAEVVAASVNGRIHVVGGRSPAGSVNLEWSDHIDTDQHWAYDAGADRWERRRPLPAPRNSSAGAVYGGALYVIAGRTVAKGNTDRVDVYDPVSDRWQKAAPLPKGSQIGAPVGR